MKQKQRRDVPYIRACRLNLLRAAAIVAVAATCALVACSRDPKVARERLVIQGDRYAAASKYPEAIIEYRNAVLKDPRDGNTHVKLAEASLKIGDVDGALREYVRAADLLPDDVRLQVQAGNVFLLFGRFDEAEASAQRVLAKDSRNVDAQILAANAMAGLKNIDAAVEQIEDALKIDPERSMAYSNLGALQLSRGKRDAAEAAFTKAVALAPGSAMAHLSLGNFYWMTSRPAEAERSFQRALEIDQRSALANRVLASFYLATDRRADAERPLKTALEVTKAPEAAIALSDCYVGLKNDAAARKILLPLLDDPRAFAEADVRLAALDVKDGRPDEALKRIAVVLGKDQTNLQALLLKSTVLLSTGKNDQALESAKAAAEHHPSSTAALFMLGRVEQALRQPDAAIRAFEETLRLNPKATAAKVALAELHLAQGQPDTSVHLTEEALAGEPGNADAQLVYVRGLLRQGEVDRAGVELKRLVASHPQSAAVHAEIGMMLGQKHDFQSARAEFDRALQLQPRNLEAIEGLVAMDLAVKDNASARARIDRAVTDKPTAPLLIVAARTYGATGDMAGAEAFLRRAIDLDPSYLAAYRGLGQLYVSQHKLPEARLEFQKSVARAPKSVAALTMIGIIDQAQGNLTSARDAFERVLQIDKEAPVAANNLAWIYANGDGNLDVALQLAETARRHLPALAEVNDTLGFIYYKKNLPDQAIPPLKRSIEKDPANATYQYHLGLVYAGTGDSHQARQLLTRALELKPSFDGASHARELLTTLQQ